ncbi:MAG: hypothetical protein PHT40_04780 [Patescibacteria group bacterium]|nr:hypothetical protein [Patescibacteria group bacterium]
MKLKNSFKALGLLLKARIFRVDEKKTIIVKKTGEMFYVAFLANNDKIKNIGRTSNQAIVNLINSRPEHFNIELKFED